MACLSRFSLLSALFSHCYLKTPDFAFPVYLIYREVENLSKNRHEPPSDRRLFVCPNIHGKEVNSMVIKITEGQSERINRIVRESCCNYADGKCLLLDDGEEHGCVQLICRYGIYCKYLLRNVLPEHNELYKEILRENNLEGEAI